MRKEEVIRKHQAKLDNAVDGLEDSRARKQFAERYNSGKLKWNLVDFGSLKSMVEVLEFGAIKYTPDNWKKGRPITDTCNSLMRHLVAFMDGEDIDPESGLPHLGHIMCNAMFLEYHMKHLPELDDR